MKWCAVTRVLVLLVAVFYSMGSNHSNYQCDVSVESTQIAWVFINVIASAFFTLCHLVIYAKVCFSQTAASQRNGSGYIAHTTMEDEMNQLGFVPTISSYSTNTVRGTHALAMASMSISMTLLGLMCVNEVLSGSVSDGWTLTSACGFVSLALVSVFPSEEVTHVVATKRRQFNVVLCCSCFHRDVENADESNQCCKWPRWSGGLHVLFTVLYLLLPTASGALNATIASDTAFIPAWLWWVALGGAIIALIVMGCLTAQAKYDGCISKSLFALESMLFLCLTVLFYVQQFLRVQECCYKGGFWCPSGGRVKG